MNQLQRNLLKTVGKSRTKEKQLLKADYAPSTARTQTARTLRAKPIQDEIKKRDVKALARYDEGFDATKIISAKIVGKNADENTDDFIEVPDYQVRQKNVDMHFKARGVYQEEKSNLVKVDGNAIIFVNFKHETTS